MEEFSESWDRTEPPGALLKPPRLKPFPARLSLLSSAKKKGSGVQRRTL